MPKPFFRITSDTIDLHTTSGKTSGEFAWEREEDQVYFRLNLNKDVVFAGEDYITLIALESNICEEVTLIAELICNGEFVELWRGKFTLQAADVDVGKCSIAIRPEPDDAYTCLKLGENLDANIFDLEVVEVKPYVIEGSYDVSPLTVGPPSDDPSLADYGEPPGGFASWCNVPAFDEVVFDFDIHTGEEHWYRRNIWHRLRAPGTCDGGTPIEPEGGFFTWTLLENLCPVGSTWWRCPGSENDALATYSYGREFSDVVEFLVDELGCPLTVVSDFFAINGDDTAPSNAAYDYAALYLQSMQIHQKSNIKRPYSSDPARRSVFLMKLGDLLHDLRVLFNVYYTIEEGVLRLEHASYFTATAGLNLVGRPMKKSYKNDFARLPKREIYRYQDDRCSDDFASNEIVYPCGKDDKEYRLRLFSNDVVWIQDIEHQDIVTDTGWVLIATRTTDSIRHIIDDNLPLAWPSLHENLHLWWKAYPQAEINGLLTDMVTWRRQRKAPPMLTHLCCDETFVPEQLPETSLGVAEVESASYNPGKNLLTLNLRY